MRISHATAAASFVGRADFVAAGDAAQRSSYTLLTNHDNRLPLASGLTVYAEGIDPAARGARAPAGPPGPPVCAEATAPAALPARATVVDDPGAADVALIRLKAPYEPRPG